MKGEGEKKESTENSCKIAYHKDLLGLLVSLLGEGVRGFFTSYLSDISGRGKTVFEVTREY